MMHIHTPAAIKAAPITLPIVFPYEECLEQKRYTSDHERSCNNPESMEEDDLCQQWRVAEATNESVKIADASIRVAKEQLFSNKIEIGLLFSTVILSLSATIAALWSVKTAVKFGRVEHAAYIAQDTVVNIAGWHRDAWQMILQWKNIGNTPADIRKTYDGIARVEGSADIPSDLSQFIEEGDSLFEIVQGQTFTTKPISLSLDEMTKLANKQARFFYIMGCGYKDWFGKDRKSQVVLEIVMRPGFLEHGWQAFAQRKEMPCVFRTTNHCHYT